MKRTILFCIIMAMIVGLWQPLPPVSGQEDGTPTTFTIVNNSNDAICFVYISPATSDSWGSDQLGETEVIAPGTSREWHVEPAIYDILLENCDEDTLLDTYGLDLTETYVLAYPEGASNVIENDTEVPLNNSTVDDLIEQGVTLIGLEQYAEAHEILQSALDFAREIQFAEGEGTALIAIGLAYQAEENYEAAVETLETAYAFIRDHDLSKDLELVSLITLAGVYNRIDQHQLSIDRYQEALLIADTFPSVELHWQINFGIAEGYLYLQQYDNAVPYYRTAIDYLQNFEDSASEILTNLGLADALAGKGQLNEAIEQYQRARSIAQEVGDFESEIVALESLGILHADHGLYEDALISYQEALQIAQEHDDPTLELGPLLGMALVSAFLENHEDELRYYEMALNIAGEFGIPELEIEPRLGIASALFLQDQYEEALEQYQIAWRIAQESMDQESELFALGGMADVYHAKGEYEQAMQAYQSELQIAKNLSNQKQEADAQRGIGQVYESQLQYDPALEHYELALAAAIESGDPTQQALVVNDIALLLYSSGQFTKARGYFEEAQQAWLMISEPELANDMLYFIGLTYAMQSNFGEARKYFEQLRGSPQAFDDPEALADNFQTIATLYAAQGQFDEALYLIDQAESISGTDDPRTTAGYQLFRAGIYTNQGEVDLALETYLQLLEFARSNGILNMEVIALDGLGLNYIVREEYDQALVYLHEALEKSSGADEISNRGNVQREIGIAYLLLGQFDKAQDHLEAALEIFQEMGLKGAEVSVRINLGYLYSTQGQVNDAIDQFAQSVELIEDVHANIQVESAQISFIGNVSHTYDALVALLAWSDPELAFHYAERGRARAFLFQLSNERLAFGSGADSTLMTEWQSKHDELVALREMQIESYTDPRARQNTDNGLESAIALAELELTQLEDRIASANPDKNQLTRVDVPSLADLQQAIPDDTTMLAYYVVRPDRNMDGELVVFVVTSESLDWKLLEPGESELATAIQAFRFDQDSIGSLQQLYDWLVVPVEEYLTTTELVIIPHGVLNYLPFAALTANGTTFLSDEHAISYVPSVTVYKLLAENRSPAAEEENWLVLGNPITADDTLPPLPFAQAEAEAVASLLDADVYVRGDATEALVRTQMAQSDGIHISAHGVFDENYALSTYLALAPGGDYDGLLEVREVYSLPLHESSPMIVLSACETNVNNVSEGDEFQGLVRAFLLSGARVVLASQWAVEDEATAVLMTEFYRNRTVGMSDAEALAAAQRTLRENVDNPQWASPFYWAAFQLVGLAN